LAEAIAADNEGVGMVGETIKGSACMRNPVEGDQ
jgi:hypothetical protein